MRCTLLFSFIHFLENMSFSFIHSFLENDEANFCGKEKGLRLTSLGISQ